MTKIKVIIIDDEKLARQEMNFLLSNFSEVEVIDEAENVDEAIEKIERLKPNLVFLDISMPEKNGFDLLTELSYTPLVIFITAYDEYAVRAFEENAFDYLLKPTNIERLKKCLAKVKEELLPADRAVEKFSLPKKVFLKDGEKCYFVALTDIFLIESYGNYARIYFGDNKVLIHRTLNQMQERLDPIQFFRANRQQIFNIEYVYKIYNYYKGGLKVTLQSGQVIEISNRNAVQFKDIMSI